MTFDNSFLKSRHSTRESVFVKSNKDIINDHIRYITASRDNVRNLFPLAKQIAKQKKEAAVGQAGKVMEQNAHIELPPEIAQTPDLVAWAEQQQAKSSEDLARQAIEQIHAGGGFDLSPPEKSPQPTNNVKALSAPTPEILAARRAIADLGEAA